MGTVIFEDINYQNLLPLVYFRPVWELRCGALTLEERMKKYLRGDFFYLAREYLQKFYMSDKKGFSSIPADSSVLFINGRWLLKKEDVKQIEEIPPNGALCDDDLVLAFKSTPSTAGKYFTDGLPDSNKILNSLRSKEYKTQLVKFPWDLIEWNGKQLLNDFESFANGQISGSISQGVCLNEESKIYIANSAQLKPGVIIDAEEGPVWIDEGVKVMANATLEGPMYIGPKSLIKIGAKLYGNTTIGPVCKIGGEVEGCIVQGYSNKQHDGFLGHAYLGSWVNLGADTNNSDLKNNYGKIKVFLNGKPVDTGKQFLGLMMGDHSKTAINTMFNTGTVVGVNCNVFGAGMPPKFVPSFSWGGAEKLEEYQLDKAIEVAKVVMNRRNIPFAEREKQLFAEVKKLADKVEKSGN